MERREYEYLHKQYVSLISRLTSGHFLRENIAKELLSERADDVLTTAMEFNSKLAPQMRDWGDELRVLHSLLKEKNALLENFHMRHEGETRTL